MYDMSKQNSGAPRQLLLLFILGKKQTCFSYEPSSAYFTWFFYLRGEASVTGIQRDSPWGAISEREAQNGTVSFTEGGGQIIVKLNFGL